MACTALGGQGFNTNNHQLLFGIAIDHIVSWVSFTL